MKTSYLINVLDEKSKLKISITHSPNFHFHNLSLDFNKSNMTGATSEEGTVYISILSEHPIHPHFFCVVRVAISLIFCVPVNFVDRCLFFFLSFFFWSLYCLSFFDLRLLITPLESSNFPFKKLTWYINEDNNIEVTLSFLCNSHFIFKWKNLILFTHRSRRAFTVTFTH
jgi:hypothetical protein